MLGARPCHRAVPAVRLPAGGPGPYIAAELARDGRRGSFYDGRGAMHASPDLAACHPILARARLARFSIENWARAPYVLGPVRAALDVGLAG